jgi:hypothetical protein
MLVTTLLAAVSGLGIGKYGTHASVTTLQTTTSCLRLEALLANNTGAGAKAQTSNQNRFKVYYAITGTNTVSTANAPLSIRQMAQVFEVVPDQSGNGTILVSSDIAPAVGLYIYVWLEEPSLGTATATMTLSLVEMN